jgi:hypothetical protein
MGFRENQRRGVADERRQVFAERRGVESEEGSFAEIGISALES